MTSNVKLLPLGFYMSRWDRESQRMAADYARANVEASTEALRANNERLAEALREALIVMEAGAVLNHGRRYAPEPNSPIAKARAALHPTAEQEGK